jgi:hypothetical protein
MDLNLDYLDDFRFAFSESVDIGETVADAIQVANDYACERQAEDGIARHLFQVLNIEVVRENPPVPTNAFDYCALLEGTEEEGNYGRGATDYQAIWDLLDTLENM